MKKSGGGSEQRLLHTQDSLPPIPAHSLLQLFHLLKPHTVLSSLNMCCLSSIKSEGSHLFDTESKRVRGKRQQTSNGPWTKQLHNFDVSSLFFSLINSMAVAALCTEVKRCSCIGAILVLFLGFSSCHVCLVHTSVLQSR